MGSGTAILLFAAAFVGGAINSVAGGGSFVSFPALLFAGVSPISANATNTIALWPGSLASVLAYRRELHEVRAELVPLGIAGLIGGLAGSILVLSTPDATFVQLIPWLLLFATSLFSFGNVVARRLARGRRASLGGAFAVQLVISVYGGYFGGGIGIMMLAVFSLLGMVDIHRMNALKTVLATLINAAAVASFVVAGVVAWGPGIVMIVGGAVGGYIGAAAARRSNARTVRTIVLAVAWTMTAYFFVRTYSHRPARAAISSPMAKEAVAAGEGAFST